MSTTTQKEINQQWVTQFAKLFCTYLGHSAETQRVVRDMSGVLVSSGVCESERQRASDVLVEVLLAESHEACVKHMTANIEVSRLRGGWHKAVVYALSRPQAGNRHICESRSRDRATAISEALRGLEAAGYTLDEIHDAVYLV